MATAIPDLTPGQELHLKRATAVTAEQIKIARDLIAATGMNPALVGHVLQALATNYAATVDASKD